MENRPSWAYKSFLVTRTHYIYYDTCFKRKIFVSTVVFTVEDQYFTLKWLFVERELSIEISKCLSVLQVKNRISKVRCRRS